MEIIEYDSSVKPDIAILFAKYYLFVKKQKRNIDFEKTFDEEELHDLQYTILLLLNHLGTDENEEPLKEGEKIITPIYNNDTEVCSE